jgi:hypothetical protein
MFIKSNKGLVVYTLIVLVLAVIISKVIDCQTSCKKRYSQAGSECSMTDKSCDKKEKSECCNDTTHHAAEKSVPVTDVNASTQESAAVVTEEPAAVVKNEPVKKAVTTEVKKAVTTEPKKAVEEAKKVVNEEIKKVVTEDPKKAANEALKKVVNKEINKIGQ